MVEGLNLMDDPAVFVQLCAIKARVEGAVRFLSTVIRGV
jgi:hypothetical protein